MLSGQLDDGVAGLMAIKAWGGTTIVQDPQEALAPQLPRYALQRVPVDHCKPALQIGPLLGRLRERRGRARDASTHREARAAGLPHGSRPRPPRRPRSPPRPAPFHLRLPDLQRRALGDRRRAVRKPSSTRPRQVPKSKSSSAKPRAAARTHRSTRAGRAALEPPGEAQAANLAPTRANRNNTDEPLAAVGPALAPFPIAAIGASAGGLEALQEPRILGARSGLRVAHAEHQQALRPGQVYVNPPDVELKLQAS